jgi:hypothetical protein
MFRGEGTRGAMILTGAIIIGSLDIIILPLISLANPAIPPALTDPRAVWAYWIPRVFHDVLAVWSIVFWIWVVADAYVIKEAK